MDGRLRRLVAAVLLTLPDLCSPQLYPRQSWPAAPGARARPRPDGLVRQSVWSIPVQHGRMPVVAERISAARVSPAPHARMPWPAPLSARGGFDGRVRERVWSFPYRYEGVPVVAKRMLETRGSDPCSGAAAQEARQSRRHDCKDAAETRATPATSTPAPANRPLRLGGWLPRPLGDDARLDFLGVLAIVGVKIIMSTALASWFLVAGQLLFAIADITGSSEIFGNGSPLVFIFQALPLVEILLRGSSTFNS